MFEAKEARISPAIMRQFEKSILLQILDTHWREHLAAMDYLRQGIHWRGYAQKNPKQEYKREAYELFASMLESIKAEVIRIICHVQLQDLPTPAELAPVDNVHHVQFQHEEPLGIAEETPVPKVGRNELCPCGSSKRYKQCHGKLG